MFCMFGYHKWMVINRLSLLRYMHLALGQTIADLETPVLIELMTQLINSELPGGIVQYDYIKLEALSDLFSKDDMVFMSKHFANFKTMLNECSRAHAQIQKLEKEISETVYANEKARLRELISGIRRSIEPQTNQLAVVTSCLLLKFCSKCHASYDPREQLGVFLPQIKKRLDVAKMNEDNGYFLLPKQ